MLSSFQKKQSSFFKLILTMSDIYYFIVEASLINENNENELDPSLIEWLSQTDL